MVKALPDEKASDLATARQSILVHINAKKTPVSLIVHPFLILIGKTCRIQSQRGIKYSYQSAHVANECVLLNSATWAWFTINTVSDSFITRDDIVLQHHICPLTDLKMPQRFIILYSISFYTLLQVSLCKEFRKTNFNSSIPVKVKWLLSVLIGSRPQRHHHQVPLQSDVVAPNSDTCQ